MKHTVRHFKFFFLNGLKYIALYGAPSQTNDGWIANILASDVIKSCSAEFPPEKLLDMLELSCCASFSDSFLKTYDLDSIHQSHDKRINDSVHKYPSLAKRLPPKSLATYCKDISSSTGFSEADVRQILTLFLQGILKQIKIKRPFYSWMLLGEPLSSELNTDHPQSQRDLEGNHNLPGSMLFWENPQINKKR